MDTRIAAVVARQHGVISRRELLALGVPSRTIGHRVAAERWHRVQTGVYSPLPPALLTREGRWMAAVLACGEGAVLSYATAAALWDIRRSSSGLIHVTVPGSRTPKRRGLIRPHRSTTLDASQITTHRGIPVTTPARTLIDLADQVDHRATERALDQLEVLQLFDLHSLDEAVRLNPGRRGAAVVGRILEDYALAAALTESELEDEFLRLCTRHALPRPEPQVWIGQDRVDFLFRREQLAIETDSRRWHGGRAATERDDAKDIRLQLAGYRVAHLSYRRILRDPRAVAEDLRALFQAM